VDRKRAVVADSKRSLVLPGDGMAFGMTYGELLRKLKNDLQLDATVDIQPGTIQSALIDKNSKSAFVQVASPSSPGRIVINFGSCCVNFPGSNIGSLTGATHNLGKLPWGVLFDIFSAGTGSNANNLTATTFDVAARTVDGAVIGPGCVTMNFLVFG